MEQVIICVDDDKFLVETLAEQIRGWVGKSAKVEKALSGKQALKILDDLLGQGVSVPVFISDYIMPGMNGAELLAEVYKRDRHIKTIMITGYTAVDGIVSAINNAGLYRFISKPWNTNDLMLTVIEARKFYEQEKKNTVLLQSFEKLYRGYEAQHEYWAKTVSHVIDMKTGHERGHSETVAKLAHALGKAEGLKADALKTLKTTAFYHDIGRLMMPESDLAEIKAKEAHIYDCPDLICAQNNATRRIFSSNQELDKVFLEGIINIYERYNGKGINGLAGARIPLDARIIGIANYYAVLTGSDNPKALAPTAAKEMLSSLCNTVFDPKLVELFVKLDAKTLKPTK